MVSADRLRLTATSRIASCAAAVTGPCTVSLIGPQDAHHGWFQPHASDAQTAEPPDTGLQLDRAGAKTTRLPTLSGGCSSGTACLALATSNRNMSTTAFRHPCVRALHAALAGEGGKVSSRRRRHSPDEQLPVFGRLSLDALGVPGQHVGHRRLIGGSPPSALWRR